MLRRPIGARAAFSFSLAAASTASLLVLLNDSKGWGRIIMITIWVAKLAKVIRLNEENDQTLVLRLWKANRLGLRCQSSYYRLVRAYQRYWS